MARSVRTRRLTAVLRTEENLFGFPANSLPRRMSEVELRQLETGVLEAMMLREENPASEGSVIGLRLRRSAQRQHFSRRGSAP
jgi:hypothetical protein